MVRHSEALHFPPKRSSKMTGLKGLGMKSAGVAFEQWVMRLVCAMALLFVGFAHQVPAIEKAGIRIDVAQYVLPDGTLPIFCITDNRDGSHKHRMLMEGCQACHINASILVPAPADLAGYAVNFARFVSLPVKPVGVFRPLFPPNTGPRAPPTFSRTV